MGRLAHDEEREPRDEAVLPEAAPPAERMPLAAGNAAVARWLGGALNADFSDVRFTTESARAAAIGARAFTEGAAVHFAPGEYRPEDPAGLELIGHELAHVVQQREGRASPTHEVGPGAFADRSPALEHEAEEQGRLAAAGRPARPAGAYSGPGGARPVIQGKFTAAAELSAADQAEISSDAIWLESIRISDKKRPPTRLEGSQGRHTVAWQAKSRFWQAHFADVSLTEAITRLRALAEGDEAVDTEAGLAGTAGREERAALLGTLQAIEGQPRTASQWIKGFEWALTTYAKAYQQSAFAAFPSDNPKGRNEAGHLAALADANDSLKEGRDPTVTERPKRRHGKRVTRAMTSDDALRRVRGLVDLSPGAPKLVLLKVFSDWLKVITTLYPKLFDPRTDAEALLRRPTADQVGLIRDHGYPLVLALFEYMRGGELVVPAVAPTEPEPEIATEPVITTEPATDPVEEEEDDEAEEATREEEPEVTEAEEVSRPEENQLRETEPFAVRVNSRLTDAESNNVGPDGITVTRLVISDERPDTRFRGGKQMSHTIPWTLARIAWARALSGKTIQAVAQALRARIATEKGWSADSTLDWVTEERDELDAALAEVDTYAMSIPEWTAWLGATVERYVEAYQASPFAAYATEATSSGESTARGRGESAAMKTLAGWDKDVKEGRPPPSEASAKAYGAKLIDVPELSSNRALVDTDKLKTRWIEDLAAAFPDLVGVRRAAFEAAFDDEAVQSAHAMELDANASQPTGVNLRKRKVVYS